MRVFLLSLILLSFCCATSHSAETQTETAKVRDTNVVKITQTGPETITTTIDTYLPPTCAQGEVLWPGGAGTFYCGSAPKQFAQPPQAPSQSTSDHPEHNQPQQAHQQAVEHGPLLSHEVVVDQKAPVVATTEAKGQTQTKTDTESKKASNWRFGPGALGWGLIAAAVLGALALAVRFKVWTLL